RYFAIDRVVDLWASELGKMHGRGRDATGGDELVQLDATLVDLPVADAVDEHVESDTHLEASDGVAQAVMNTVPERPVSLQVLPIEVEDVRIRIHPLVVVCRTVEHEKLVASRNRHS